MKLTGLIDSFRQSQEYHALLARLQAEPAARQTIIRAARPFLLAALVHDWQGPLVYLTSRGRRAYNITEQLPVWLGDERRILRFAEPTPMFYDRLPWDRAVIRERLATLAALQRGETPIIVTSARALMQRTLPPHQLRQNTLALRRGGQHMPEKLAAHLVGMGYEAATMCAEPGSFTRRGGILDIYPIDAAQPVRLEFFGDEIDTLKTFDPTTQRSTGQISSVDVPPAREALPRLMPPAAAYLAERFQGRLDDDGAPLSTAQDLDALQSGQAFSTLEHYLPFVVAQPACLLDHLPPDALVLAEDPDDIEARVQELESAAEANRHNNVVTGQIVPDHPTPYVTWPILAEGLAAHRTLALASSPDDNADAQRLFVPAQRHSGQLRSVVQNIQRAISSGDAVVVVSSQVERLTALWAEQTAQEFVPQLDNVEQMPAGVAFVRGELSEGWELRAGGRQIYLITDSEIFNWQRPEPRRRKTGESGKRRPLPESDYADWKPGEYVVHIDYGIGQFVGLQARTSAGTEREYLVIQYDGSAVVFVPIDQADRLTRYVGADDKAPQLNNISKPVDWLKAKEKARKAAEEEARELLGIYARRASVQGYAFRPDTVYQTEMEASFPYVETEDQLRVIREIKADMEATMPMDRLVTGDVGYGKTEVAIRAAFKAVMDGKQVAVLVPTTVLADQHYHTFARRMEGFGVVVELMSRFRTRAEQSEILTRLANGKVDIIIGTHRLLSDDVTLPNLGLVIIDEEQRFGVKHKEHFKKFRANVDVLTLTATPIPRTLYMSLSGVRDISMIQTPPEERLPVITHVGPFNNKLARQAILRELDRGGQVFIIHNRIKTIAAIQDKFAELVPEASIIHAHGQMGGKELEGIINAFSRGQYDVLLATSIIENGIDMPNVNTLIVDRAEWFGLSQLYQIRGRVGRGAQQAYAYFFHAKGSLTEEARQRLDTLAEYSDLGVGFQIAVRDLEIRGAGDILSMKQSGHITTVGLQLYTQLLSQAVSRLKAESKGEALPEPPAYERERIVIDLPLAAYIPDHWIPEMALRLQLYRRIGSLQSIAEVEALRTELRDRFGELPNAVEGLLYQIHIKLLAQAINATAVIKPRDHILIRTGWLHAVDRPKLARLMGADVEVSRTAVELKPQPHNWRQRLIELLENLRLGMPEGVGI
jgi:transcription-repair coupling factor (superfamily II helicase)